MRVGSELKAARKKAGITVEVLSKRTKVKVSNLVGLEKGDFKQLPTGVYLFSMVRAYAREVHIDPEPIVERLRAEFKVIDTLEALTALDKSGALRSNSMKADQTDSRPSGLKHAVIAAGVLLTVIGAGAYLYSAGLP